MAEVYRAYEERLQRAVAVKILPPALATDAEYVRRFRQEARNVAALRHPHIVPVYHYGEDEGLLYLVMPIFSESLRRRLDHEERLAVDEAIRLISEIASALEAAHAHDLVHRDVKPENILLDESDHALLTDFGIARRLTHARHSGAQTLSATGLPVGTPEYMAPEQLRGGAVDRRADIYGLGAVLYETLTGQAPHEGETPYEVATLVLTTPVTPPGVRNPHVWPALDRVTLKALAQRPEDRYQTAAGFASALQEAVSARDEPEPATPLASEHDNGLSSPETLPHEAPTLPAIPLVPPHFVARVHGALAGTSRNPRVLLTTLVTLLVVAAFGGAAVASGFGLMRGARTIFMPGTVVTATPPPSANATSTPFPPALALSPSPLVLLQQDRHTCGATQTITNQTGEAVGWSWEPPAVDGFTFQVNRGPEVTWPSNRVPGIAPGGADTLRVISDCKHQSISVHLTDTLGQRYTFALTVR
jgi:serine/threonine-protein kinase